MQTTSGDNPNIDLKKSNPQIPITGPPRRGISTDVEIDAEDEGEGEGEGEGEIEIDAA
eukprot:CAMPEP_0182431568 /NCGR_PEP_ID=MMETSP1167-20130531/50210_1 /TAXON_ID=2988 /ORGANISM="Mallomonas Sp, Strain CCMP3275" /LENGTH=57 /DNA_ID=CAMNT_0024618057 /DNA_START=6 /DNA_END=176 /DNA_ORIENTATION=+